MSAGFAGFSESALIFFEGLEADNSRPYWTDHKAQYDADVRAPFLALLAALEPEFGGAHVFRPYRDVRFSRDKLPYKTQIGAVVGRGEAGSGAYYVQLSASGMHVAGGYWRTASDQVARLREGVADERTGAELARILDDLGEAGMQVGGEQLKTVPRGYPREHPRADLLRHKNLTAGRSAEPGDWLHTAGVLDWVAQGWRAVRPLNTWLETQVGATREPARPRR